MNLVEQSIAQAMDEPDDRMMFTQVKDIVARHLRRMDPGATVTKTEFFNHTHVPDMVLEWPGRPRTPRRFIYLRTTSDQRELEDDLQRLPRADRPVLLALGQLSSTRQRGDLPRYPAAARRSSLTLPRSAYSMRPTTLPASLGWCPALSSKAAAAPSTDRLPRNS